jgi:hypothetical protein
MRWQQWPCFPRQKHMMFEHVKEYFQLKQVKKSQKSKHLWKGAYTQEPINQASIPINVSTIIILNNLDPTLQAMNVFAKTQQKQPTCNWTFGIKHKCTTKCVHFFSLITFQLPQMCNQLIASLNYFLKHCKI